MKIRLAVAAAVLSLGAAALAAPSPADPSPPLTHARGVAGCGAGSAVVKASPWGKTFQVVAYLPPDGPPEEWTKYRAGTHFLYLYCPNGSGPAKIKPLSLNVCITLLDRFKSYLFSYYTFNAVTTDIGSDIEFYLPGGLVGVESRIENQGDFSCGSVQIAESDQHWYFMRDLPRWRLYAVAHVKFLDDVAMRFRSHGHIYRLFSPADDPIVNPFRLLRVTRIRARVTT